MDVLALLVVDIRAHRANVHALELLI